MIDVHADLQQDKGKNDTLNQAGENSKANKHETVEIVSDGSASAFSGTEASLDFDEDDAARLSRKKDPNDPSGQSDY